MSGGTRCNVLPFEVNIHDYHTTSSKNRLKKIFKSWRLDDCLDWFMKDIGLEMVCEKETNKWFPKSNSAKEVRNLLVQKVHQNRVQIEYNKAVHQISRSGNQWKVHTDDGTHYVAEAVIFATGGLSIPTIGTDGLGHKVLKKYGINQTELFAALTPLTTNDSELKSLAGISLDVEISLYIDGKKDHVANRSGFLFTHKGFSGQSVLDLSHYAVRELDQKKPLPEFRMNWAGMDRNQWEHLLLNQKGTVKNLIAQHLPSRLAQLLCRRAGIHNDTLSELKKDKRKKLLELLTEFQLPVTGHEGYRKAEVTGGGVPLELIDTATMEVSSKPGLYLCGEIVDVFGRIGGFNFYWAWVSGRLAGLSAASDN